MPKQIRVYRVDKEAEQSQGTYYFTDSNNSIIHVPLDRNYPPYGLYSATPMRGSHVQYPKGTVVYASCMVRELEKGKNVTVLGCKTISEKKFHELLQQYAIKTKAQEKRNKKAWDKLHKRQELEKDMLLKKLGKDLTLGDLLD